MWSGFGPSPRLNWVDCFVVSTTPKENCQSVSSISCVETDPACQQHPMFPKRWHQGAMPSCWRSGAARTRWEEWTLPFCQIWVMKQMVSFQRHGLVGTRPTTVLLIWPSLQTEAHYESQLIPATVILEFAFWLACGTQVRQAHHKNIVRDLSRQARCAGRKRVGATATLHGNELRLLV